MTNLLYSAKHYQTKCAETLDSVINYANIATELLNDAKNTAKSAAFGNIGDIKYTIRKDVPNGGFWCDGATFDKQDLEQVYQMLVAGKLQSLPMDEFEAVVTENGSCGFFGLDTENKKFRVPLLNDVYLKAGLEAEEFGAESLPNIKGNFRTAEFGWDPIGVFKRETTEAYSPAQGSGKGLDWINFNASRSSSTYKDGAKVNPDHVKYRAYIILFSGEKELSLVNWTKELQNYTENLKKELIEFGATTITYWD